MSAMRELKITPIKNGTVIDHIGNGLSLEVLKIIGVNELDKDSTVSVALHVRSQKLGWKDIVKVENMELSPRKVNAIALIAPTATISIIRDFQVREKRPVDLPDRIVGVDPMPELQLHHEPPRAGGERVRGGAPTRRSSSGASTASAPSTSSGRS